MAKESYYFPHDYGARNDPKLQRVLKDLNHEGISIFWGVIEMLYENGGRLELAECDSYAFALRTQCDIIKRVVHDFNLFQNDGVFFWSNSVLSRLKDREEKSEKARKSAEKRWYNANALPTHSERNAKKEKKGKEKKESIERETRSQFTPPTLEEVIDEFTLRGFTNPKPEAEKFWNYYEANGWMVGKSKMKKWKSAVAGWISRNKEFAITKTGYKPPETNINLPAYKPYVDKTRDVKREPMPQDIRTLLQGVQQ